MTRPPSSAHCHGRHCRIRLGLILVLVSTFGSGGCGRVERARECQALVATINPALDAIEARQDAGADQRAMLREAARRYDHLAARVARLRFSNASLTKDVRDYTDCLRRAAQAARAIAAALEHGNLGAITRAQTEMATVVRKEKALARRLSQKCQNP